MMRPAFRLTLLALKMCLTAPIVSAPGFAADPIVNETSTTETRITFEDGAYLINTINRRHDTAAFFDDRDAQGAQGGGVMRRFLVQTEIDRLTREADDQEIDPQRSTLRIVARPLSQSGLGDVSMQVETVADEVAVSGPYVVTTIWGCCVEQPAHEVYSLYSGKRLFSATGPGDFGDWLTMGKKGPTYDQRIIAAHIAITARDKEELGENQDTVAVITYATEAEPLQRLALSVPGGRDGDLPLEWNTKLLWVTADQPDGVEHNFINQDGDAKTVYTGIKLRMQLDDATRIEIPLEADRLVPGKATLPDGFTLSDVPL
jgi:hypothetical protein